MGVYSRMKKYINGKYIELTQEEIQQKKAEQEAFEKTKEFKQMKIAELKQNLTDTDYAIIKIAEGSATAEEYSEIIKQRKEWREEINRLESELNGN